MDSESDVHVPIESQDVKVTIYNLKENLMKLCSLTEKLDISRETETVPCDIVDLSWLDEEKLEMAKAVVDLEDSDPNLNMTEAEMLLDLYKMLVHENKQLEDVLRGIRSTQEKGSKLQEYFDFITKNQKCLETIEMGTSDKVNIELLLKKSMEKLRDTRNNFHNFLESVFKNTGISQLIQDLTVAYFQGGDDKYINLAEYNKTFYLSDINMLKEYHIITVDPYDQMKIKISDIVHLQ